jgi:hypothetical protein
MWHGRGAGPLPNARYPLFAAISAPLCVLYVITRAHGHTTHYHYHISHAPCPCPMPLGRIPWPPPPREISGEEAQARTRFFWA